MEAVSCFALLQADTSQSTFRYPSEILERLWKLLLLNQFHDVLPGSSIEMVLILVSLKPVVLKLFEIAYHLMFF